MLYCSVFYTSSRYDESRQVLNYNLGCIKFTGVCIISIMLYVFVGSHLIDLMIKIEIKIIILDKTFFFSPA